MFQRTVNYSIHFSLKNKFHLQHFYRDIDYLIQHFSLSESVSNNICFTFGAIHSAL